MKVLIVKLSSLGDVIQTMPVVQDLLRWNPQAQIDWVVEEAFAPLLQRVQGIHRVIPIALRRWRQQGWFKASTRRERQSFLQNLQQDSYAGVIDGQGLIKSALVARQARLAPGGRCGSFANKSEACGYEWPVKFLLPHNQAMPRRIHAVARTRLLAAQLLGFEVQGPPQVLFKDLPSPSVPEEWRAGAPLSSNTPTRIFLAHGTTRADNEWPFGHWLELAQKLVACSFTVVVAQHNEKEQRFCQALQAACATPGTATNHVQVLPLLGLSALLDEMSMCAGVIGVDSGLSHLAVALDLPHVQIFSQDRAWRAGPPDVAHQLAIGGAQAPDLDTVWNAWQSVWQQRHAILKSACKPPLPPLASNPGEHS